MTVVDKNQKHDNNKYICADTVKTLTRPAHCTTRKHGYNILNK